MSSVTNYNIEDNSGANVRIDLNAVFAAIQSSNSESSDLATSKCVAGMPFLNTTSNELKIRNSSNGAFTTIGNIDQANLGLLSKSGGTMTGQFLADDSNSASKGGLILTNPVNNATGTYDFADTLDLGSTFSLVLKRHFQGVGFYTGDQFDNRTDNIDTWVNFDGTEAPDANATLAVRTSTDMSSYSDFNDFANGTFKGRGFQFRVTLNTSDTAQNINLQQLGYSATLPSRTEQSSVIASGAGAKAVTFTAPFFVGTSGLGNLNSFLPSINISPQNMATGDYFELSSISGTGFTVHFKNSSNASIDRNFTYSAVGFGKGG